MDVSLTTHKCNETDKDLFSKNWDYIDSRSIEKVWPHLYCLDNPEKIELRQGKFEQDITALWIEA